MNYVDVLSPAKIILFGEHAVVYDKIGVAAAVGKYSRIRVSSSKDDFVTIHSKNLELCGKMTKDDIFALLRSGGGSGVSGVDEKLIPSFVVAGKVMEKYGFAPLSIEIDSDVPKNLGSSASVFCGVAKGVSEYLGVVMGYNEIGDFANSGDMVVHGEASGIDANTVAYGEWVRYKRSEGLKRFCLDYKPSFVIVDSGEPARTVETVGSIRRQMDENPDFVRSVFDELEKISLRGLKSLENCDDCGVGVEMNNYYDVLKKLGISTPRLDEVVEIGKDYLALGVKPTGGWGGGVCIVLVKDDEQSEEIVDVYKSCGFNAFSIKLGVDGTRVL